MFIFPRSALAVIAALVLAWLLPQLADRFVNDGLRAGRSPVESGQLHAANTARPGTGIMRAPGP